VYEQEASGLRLVEKRLVGGEAPVFVH